jgi:hypothetical protein
MARHGRCASRWISATWRSPLATDGMGELPLALRSDQRSLRRLAVHARRGYGAYGGWPTWPRTTSRQSVSRRSRCFCISLSSFQNSFSLNFQTKVHLWSEARLKITHPSTTFTKVGRGFVQEIEQEHHAKLTNFSAPVNSGLVPCFAIFTLLHSNPAMPLNSKVVCLEILHIFPFGSFEVFREILENVPKF